MWKFVGRGGAGARVRVDGENDDVKSVLSVIACLQQLRESRDAKCVIDSAKTLVRIGADIVVGNYFPLSIEEDEGVRKTFLKLHANPPVSLDSIH